MNTISKMPKTETEKVTNSSPTYCTTDQQQNKMECTSTTMVKFVKWRSADKDKNYELYHYVSYNREDNVEDTVSIPMHPENILFQEMFHHVHSKSPYRIVFRFVGTDEETGETCHNFSHLTKVNCVDFTRKFTNIKIMFQIICQLPSVKDLQISLNHENLLVSEAEAAQLRRSGEKKYDCTSLKRLVIFIVKWDDTDPVAVVGYEKLRFNVILKYAKLCCPNLESIRVMNDENDKNTSCFKTLKTFREMLHDQFVDVTISWEPTKKKQLTSNSAVTTDKEKAENVSSVPQIHEASVTDFIKQEGSTERKLAPPIAFSNLSGSNKEEEQHPVQHPFPSSSTHFSKNQRVGSTEGDRASNSRTVCTEPIYSGADMEATQENNEFNDCVVFDHSVGGQPERPSLRVHRQENDSSLFNRSLKQDRRRTPQTQGMHATYETPIPVTPCQNRFAKKANRGGSRVRGRGRSRFIHYTNPYSMNYRKS